MENTQMKRQEEELVIDLGELVYVLWRKLPVILLVTIITTVAGFLYSSQYLTPLYESSTSMYVLNKQDEAKTTVADLQSSTMLSTDYAQMIKSRIVLNKIIEEMGLDISASDLAEEISVDTPGSERIIVVSVKDADPKMAMDIANVLRDVAAEHIKNVMNLEAVNVVDYAELPTMKCEPNEKKYTIFGALVGLVLMCGIFTVRFVMNDSIRSTEDIEKRLGLSCLAVVPTDRNIKKRKRENN